MVVGRNGTTRREPNAVSDDLQCPSCKSYRTKLTPLRGQEQLDCSACGSTFYRTMPGDFQGSETRLLQTACYDCGRKYGDEFGFPDLVIPDEHWKAISPTGDEGSLLCPSCICRRLHDAGIETTGKFTSGPLAERFTDEACDANTDGR